LHPVLFTIFGREIPTYGVCIAIGLILCGVTFYLLIKAKGMPEAVFEDYLTAALIGIAVGFGSAYLFQAFYNLIAGKGFTFGGLTFMGGLIGGIIGGVGSALLLVKDKKRRQAFWDVLDMAMPCIFIAHCLGRIGCFFAGCCYGIHTPEGDPFGVVFLYGNGADGEPRYPTQLFEALFLFAMFLVGVAINLRSKKRGYAISVYAISYGIWRFIIEFLRDDYRGGIEGAALSPSQVQSIVFVAVGIAMIVLVYFLRKKGVIVQEIDWTEDLEKEKRDKEEIKRKKAELKAQRSAVSYEEYNDSIEQAEKELREIREENSDGADE
jgi:phosphatidylglycerol:prolipoprotein diacylglycerol transferase